MTLGARAKALLQAAAKGHDLPRDEVHDLARDWLAATGGELAMRVLVGGEFEAARTVELCTTILRLAGQAQALPGEDAAEGQGHGAAQGGAS